VVQEDNERRQGTYLAWHVCEVLGVDREKGEGIVKVYIVSVTRKTLYKVTAPNVEVAMQRILTGSAKTRSAVVAQSHQETVLGAIEEGAQ
jgi:hypothetical protein